MSIQVRTTKSEVDENTLPTEHKYMLALSLMPSWRRLCEIESQNNNRVQ